MPSYLDPDIFVNNISSTLYREHFENLYWTCRSIHAELNKSGEYIYKEICLHHKPHSINGLPAIIHYSGTQLWYKEGRLHRDADLPALIYEDGHELWYKEGKRHRDGDLPALINMNGDSEWYKEGKLHRDGDLPAIISKFGCEWYKEGERHRDGYLPDRIYSNDTL
jgi:hypothetical protein